MVGVFAVDNDRSPAVSNGTTGLLDDQEHVCSGTRWGRVWSGAAFRQESSSEIADEGECGRRGDVGNRLAIAHDLGSHVRLVRMLHRERARRADELRRMSG